MFYYDKRPGARRSEMWRCSGVLYKTCWRPCVYCGWSPIGPNNIWAIGGPGISPLTRPSMKRLGKQGNASLPMVLLVPLMANWTPSQEEPFLKHVLSQSSFTTVKTGSSPSPLLELFTTITSIRKAAWWLLGPHKKWLGHNFWWHHSMHWLDLAWSKISQAEQDYLHTNGLGVIARAKLSTRTLEIK